VLIAHRISYLLGRTQSAYEAWRKVQNVRKLADRRMLRNNVEKQKGCRPIDEKTQKERKRDREEQKDYVFSCI